MMQKREDLKGLITALLVPFDGEGNVNEEGLRQIIRHNIEEMKVDGLYVGGSTGENFMLDKATKKQIFNIAHDETNGEVKLIGQIGSPNLYEAIELGNFVTDLGYDAISAVTPFYYQFDVEEVVQYYFDIANAVNNDLIIYLIPALTGVDMGMDEFSKLFAHDRIIGVKYTVPDFLMLDQLRRTFPDVLIYFGVDEMVLPSLMYGVDGVIGSTYNINGVRVRQTIKSLKNNDINTARKLQGETNDLISSILSNGLYPTIKAILQFQGCDKGEFKSRKPMKSLTEEQKEQSKRIYNKFLN